MLDLSHKKMVVWQKSIELLKEVYRVTDKLPSEEKFGLISQLRRAAVSVVSNISEGEARKTSKEKRRFYEMSCASLVEIDAQIEISLELEFIKNKDVQQLSGLLNECFAMLSKLKRSR
jgi:four helix bundle protein